MFVKLEQYQQYVGTTIWGKKYRVLMIPRVAIENTILSSCNGTEDKIIQKDLYYKLMNRIYRMDSRQQTIVLLRYLNGMTLTDISKVLQLSVARISQLHTDAILRLRRGW